MGSTRDFVASTLADALLPVFRRSMEDVVYETLDRRQIPTRTDFKELRDVIDGLRGQSSGSSSGVKKLAEKLDELTASVQSLEKRLATLEQKGSNGTTADIQAQIQQILASQARGEEPPPLSKTLTCKVPGCDEAYRSKGFCGRHYQKWRRGTLDGFPYA